MSGSKHRGTDGSYENRKDLTTNYSSSKRECNDDLSNHRKYIRTQSSSSNRSSQQQQQRQNGDKEKKTTKEPLRVVVDWSEFRSSGGKTYFYNCKTEVSQWEKPKGWPSDTPSTSSSRSKKCEIAENSSRQKMDESSRSSIKEIQSHSKTSNNNQPTSIPSNGTNDVQNDRQTRLPSPTDDSSSRMSFSSTSSQESSAQQMNGTNETNVHPESSNRPVEKEKSESPMEIDGQTATMTKNERDQEIQRYYRAELIQHLTDWSSTQFEKQCLKLFDEYYGCSAKMSNALSELKAFKSNYRVLEIKRSILTQKLLRCEQHLKERENDSFT